MVTKYLTDGAPTAHKTVFYANRVNALGESLNFLSGDYGRVARRSAASRLGTLYLINRSLKLAIYTSF
jgi:hypothetical protein